MTAQSQPITITSSPGWLAENLAKSGAGHQSPAVATLPSTVVAPFSVLGEPQGSRTAEPTFVNVVPILPRRRGRLADRIRKLADLEPGWDDEGSVVPTDAAITTAAAFALLLPDGTPDPKVLVDRDGCITLEWTTRDLSYRVSVHFEEGIEVTATFLSAAGAERAYRWQYDREVPPTVERGLARFTQI